MSATSPIPGGFAMSRRLVNLTLDTLEDLPRPCRKCVYWELDPVSAERLCFIQRAVGTDEELLECLIAVTRRDTGGDSDRNRRGIGEDRRPRDGFAERLKLAEQRYVIVAIGDQREFLAA